MERNSARTHSVSITEADLSIERVQRLARRLTNEMRAVSPLLDKIFSPEPSVKPIDASVFPQRAREFCRQQLTPLATSHPRLGEILKEWWSERKDEKPEQK